MGVTKQSFDEGPRTAIAITPVRFALSALDRKVLWLMLASLILVRFAAMFALPLVDTTEARYAEIARIMLETGDWITPQFDHGVPFWGKPPLHTWLSAAGMALFGVGEFGARFFIGLTGLAVLALTFHWVKRLAGPDQALLVCVALFSSVMFFGAAAFVMTDMVMLLGLTLSMIGFHTSILGTANSRFWGRMAFVGLSIGLLAKGPVAVVLTGIALIPWLALTMIWHRLRQIPWVSGLALLALLTLPWYLAAEAKTPGFLQYFLIGEHFERFVVSGWEGDLYGSGHARPTGVIWLYGLGAFLPWTLFAIPLALKQRIHSADVSKQNTQWHLYLLFWMLSPLLLFSPAANLLTAYALPSLPAAAILLVSIWASKFGAPTRLARMAFVSAACFAGIVFSLLCVLAVLAPQSLRFKTERELVQYAQGIQPDIGFTYWGGRSFSADFYTQSSATYTIRTSAIRALLENTRRDAVAITADDAEALTPFLRDGFDKVGTFGRRVLFIEKTASGANS